MATTEKPESPLDRIGRDLSRTVFHGTRVTDSTGVERPLTVATGQQLPVNVPPVDAMNFTFTAGASTSLVRVDNSHAVENRDDMRQTTGADKDKYLTLEIDPTIPTWSFQPRQFTVANPPAQDDTVDVVLSGVALTSLKLPVAVLRELDKSGSNVSLCKYNAVTQSLESLSRDVWRPAITVRLPLKKNAGQATFAGVAAGMQVYQIEGTPQGDRWFLDQLNLLLSAVPDPNATIAGISLSLERKDSSNKLVQTHISEWTIARTNLTQEARFNHARDLAPAPPPLPYVANSGVSVAVDTDAVRLLQMISITNSGGYYIRATTAESSADSLVLTVILNPVPDSSGGNVDSALLPLPANAIALVPGTSPDSVRFNGLTHIHVVPSTPPGKIPFGWLRNLPIDTTTPEYGFGAGTVSIVGFTAHDATGQEVLPPKGEYTISPQIPLQGNGFQRAVPTETAREIEVLEPHSSKTAAMQLITQRAALSRDPQNTESYRSTLQCYADLTSPWTRLLDPDPRKAQISIVPHFRDLYGNLIPAAAAPVFNYHFFYTDALVSPAEWPGVRFTLYPILQAGTPALTLEMSYRFLATGASKGSRLQLLQRVIYQLQGGDAEVSLQVLATPLVQSAVKIQNIPRLVQQLSDWMTRESVNAAQIDNPDIVVLQTIPCDGMPTAAQPLPSTALPFRPVLKFLRTNTAHLPASTDLPTDTTLSNIINTQVSSAQAEIVLQGAPTPTVAQPTDISNPDNEFRNLATTFQQLFSAPFEAQFAFMRDHVNLHELWLLPNILFPTATKTGDWSFATPRPLSNKLGTENMTVPNFSTPCTAPALNCWQNFPIVDQTLADQDYDQLGRIALSLLETETADLGLLLLAGNALLMSSLLSTREQIANRLATFDGYLVPISATPQPGDLAGTAITRIAVDALLSDINAFYGISTIIQLPLTRPGDEAVHMFQGTVTPTYASAPATGKAPVFSDLLLRGGEEKITLLYDLPTGSSIAAAPAITSLGVTIPYVQMPLDGSGASSIPFDPSPWLELASPVQLSWNSAAKSIPVVDRRFPEKPIIQSSEALRPWTDAITRAVSAPASISAVNVGLLAKWGWTCSFGFVNADINDKIYATILYNTALPVSASRSLARDPEWRPTTLLQGLYVLKLLQDNWGTIPPTDRLTILSKLAGFLLDLLQPGTAREPQQLAREQTTLEAKSDCFSFIFNTNSPQPISTPVMRVLPELTWGETSPSGLTKATLTALADASTDTPAGKLYNDAELTGTTPVRDYKLQLQLLRNEELNGAEADSRLIYACAPVQSPLECRPQNLWTPPLSAFHFDMTDQTLETALQIFFTGLLNGADLQSLDIEVGIALFWQKAALAVTTPFSILPTDVKPDIPATGNTNPYAAFVLAKCRTLLGDALVPPAETANAAIRLRVKISTGNRTLLEIAAIDFALTYPTA